MAIVKFNNRAGWDVDRLLNDFLNENSLNRLPGSLRTDLPVNIYEGPEQFIIEVNAPGRQKDRFNVKLEDASLVIRYEGNKEQQEQQHKVLRREFRTNGFTLSFHVDEQVEGEQINARYELGILQVVLPKKKPARPIGKTIAVQ